MRALQMTGWQQDPEFREVPTPDPGPGEVLIKVGGAGACHSDLHLAYEFPEGILPLPIPFTLGHENAGWVEAMGPGVTGFEVGQPVAVHGPWGCGHCHPCRGGVENYCDNSATLPAMGGGLGFNGGMAPYMLVGNARHLVPLASLDPVEAAPLTDAGLTPYHAIKRSLPLLVPGSHIVVIGVGGLGHMGVQIASALSPATVIAVDTRQSALDLATSAGAHHGVLVGEDTAAHVRELTKGRGAEVVIDMVGSDATLALGAALSRPQGHLTLVGIGGGSFNFSFFSQPYEVSLATTYWGSVTELMEVVALAEAGHISAHIERFPLDDVMSAYGKMRDGSLEGRAVIVPN